MWWTRSLRVASAGDALGRLARLLLLGDRAEVPEELLVVELVRLGAVADGAERLVPRDLRDDGDADVLAEADAASGCFVYHGRSRVVV